MKLYGLLITKDDHDVFADWCRDQLPLYDAVVCLDGSSCGRTARVAAEFAARLHYLHERDFAIPRKTDHGLRRVVHAEICRRFGFDNWVMVCHADEFCYHDPRKVARKATAGGYDSVAWYSVHFLPHPDELGEWERLRSLPVPERLRYYHWSPHGSGLPWLEHRLYRNNTRVQWDDHTHGSTTPHQLQRAAPFHPLLRHYKVATTDLSAYERGPTAAHYQGHWAGLEYRTGLALAVERFEDFFVAAYPPYERCDRFDGTFGQPWNIGEAYRPDLPTAPPGERRMSKRRQKSKKQARAVSAAAVRADHSTVEHALTPEQAPLALERAARLAAAGDFAESQLLHEQLLARADGAQGQALVENNLAVLAAVIADDARAARPGLEQALATDGGCEPARLNLAFVAAEQTIAGGDPGATLSGERTPSPPTRSTAPVPPDPAFRTVKVAVVSFLFNWPSTGGGIFHTVELAQFLIRAGYQVRHFYACYPPWGIGSQTGNLPFPSQALDFAENEWNLETIKARFRRAVAEFAPDHVILTDSWNIKPHLAEAVRDYPYILRFQALECLCPLNGVRLLSDDGRSFRQCANHQLAGPEVCRRCVRQRGHQSGQLHQLERALSGFGSAAYARQLERAVREAEAVLVVNPLQEVMFGPYNANVRLVTAGMDAARFPWPGAPEPPRLSARTTLLFAGLVEEPMKGFDILHQACALLWARRQDFELFATGEPRGRVDDFTQFIGWQSQDSLPQQLRAADVVVVPTVAQEALGRTAVEAMAAGRPVVASRLGGLPFTVADGATGLLCEPGNPEDLARRLAALLDDAAFRERLGQAGRRRFEEHYSWEVIVERHYRPLLQQLGTRPVPRALVPDDGALDAASPIPMQRGDSDGYRPFIPDRIDADALIEQLSRLLGLDRPVVEAQWRTYQSFSEAKGYAQTLGEYKTLCYEEAFVLYVLCSVLRPRTLVEIGTQHGKSTRRLIDVSQLLGLDSRIVCFDLTDQVRHFVPGEAELVLRDVSGRFQQEVLEALRPELIFLDTHGYHLLRETISQTLAAVESPVLVIHDCGPGLCNPLMTLSPDDPAISSSTGLWERHVLAEMFGVADPLSKQLDWLETPGHRLAILPTPHGLGVLLPQRVARANARPRSTAAVGDRLRAPVLKASLPPGTA